MPKISLFFLFLLTSCAQSPKNIPSFTWQEIAGREEQLGSAAIVRRPVYRAKVPSGWERVDPSLESSLSDTTKPIVSFLIDEKIQITVHNFPSKSLEDRIPPAFQIERWKQQIDEENPLVEPWGHSGFIGLYFEGKKGKTTILAWSMQLDSSHYQTLSFLANSVEEEEHFKQMKADYTIKVNGPTELIEKHRAYLLLFANSFELIQEIPAER